MPRNHEMSRMVLPVPAGAMPSTPLVSQVSTTQSLPLRRANLPCGVQNSPAASGVSGKRQINTRHISKHKAHPPVNIKSNSSVTICNQTLTPYTTAWAPWKTGTEVKTLDFSLWNAETDAGLMWFPSSLCNSLPALQGHHEVTPPNPVSFQAFRSIRTLHTRWFSGVLISGKVLEYKWIHLKPAFILVQVSFLDPPVSDDVK